MLWEHDPKGECFHSFFDVASSAFLSSYRNTILNQSASARIFFGLFSK